MMTPKAPQKAILLIAVSSEAQAADDRESMRAQERDLRAIAERDGWAIADVIRIPGFSRSYYTYREFADAAANAGITDPLRMFDHWQRRDFALLAVRDGSRFGREQSIFAEVVARTLDAGARIFTLADGYIDNRNRELFVSMGSYKARRDISELIDRRRMAMEGKRQRGLPVSSRLLQSHLRIRDANTGKVTGLQVDESKRQLWTDLAALMLEGVYFGRLSLELFNRFGHGVEGRPYSNNFYRLLFTPLFWGHLAQYYNEAHRQGYALWRIEPGHETPEGVRITYNVAPAVYTGDLSERVRAEMRRRVEIGHGKGRTNTVLWWRGLFVCDGCGYTCNTNGMTGQYRLVCTSNYAINHGRSCPNPAFLWEDEARAYITARLEDIIAIGPKALAIKDDERPNVEGLRAERARLEDRAQRIVRQRIDYAGTDIEAMYTRELEDVSREIAALKARLSSAERELARRKGPDMRTIEELKANGVDWFWGLSSVEQNQRLHAIFGDLRIVLQGRRPVGLIPKQAIR